MQKLPRSVEARWREHTLISSTNVICILHGICDSLWKMKKDDQESGQDSVSIVLTPRDSESASLSRAEVADNFSGYAWIACGNLSAPISVS